MINLLCRHEKKIVFSNQFVDFKQLLYEESYEESGQRLKAI
jgi:hypothetical protein